MGAVTTRERTVSSFTIIKGAMVDETYAMFAAWDFERSKRQNLDRLRRENLVGAGSDTWLRDIAKVLNRRFDPTVRDRALVQLAKNGCSLDEWKPLLLWHMTRDEFLLRDFLQNWLFPVYDSGAFRIRPKELQEYLRALPSRGGITEHEWTDATLDRVAAGLLKMATDFGLLRGTVMREFASYHLPERSFLYLLHAMRDEKQSPVKVVAAPDWRMFLMRPAEVEQELLRLHQFRKLEYHVAGSLVELSLPCASSREYAERMVA
jgi:bacteriophage exclusion system BrxA-like protein